MSPAKQNSSVPESRMRPVRSFVLRSGRLTDGQQRALDRWLPHYGLPHDDRALDFAEIFTNTRPVVMEIGFGNGEALLEMARAEPQFNFVGAEVHLPGVGHLLLKLGAAAAGEGPVENVRVFCGDGVELLSQRVADCSLAQLRLYFADPWPKKRHHKRRLVQPEFVALVAQKLAPGGLLHLATDWRPYAEHMLAVLQESAEFENLSPDGSWVERPEWRPVTKYERRGQRLGHEVFDLLFQRRRPEDGKG